MFVMTKQAVLFRRPDGETFRAPNGYVGAVPDWVTETKQFNRQVAAGKIVASQTAKDKDMEAADTAAKKGSKKKGQTDPENGKHGGEKAPEVADTAESAPEATKE